MRETGIPRWLGALIGIGLIAGLLSLYLAGDWRDGDVSLYHTYALGFWGALAHPLLPAEYPPLAILPLSLTLAGPPAWYPDVFAFWMGVLAIVGYLAFRRWTSSRQATAYAAYALAAGIATLVFRYDLLPALLSVAAVWLMQRNRFAPAYPLLALATLLKLFPAVLLPVAVVAQWRACQARGRSASKPIAVGIASFVGVVAVVTAGAALLDRSGWLSAFGYELGRPIEVESLPGTLIALGSLFGLHTSPVDSYGSLNIASALSPAVDALANVSLLAGLLWVYRGQVRGRYTTGQAATAAVLVLLCTSKVLSPQYLIWVVPLMATTVGFQMRWFALFVLTAFVFPTLWEVGLVVHRPTITFGPMLLSGIALRNGLLILLTARFLHAPGTDLEAPRVATSLAGAISLSPGEPRPVPTVAAQTSRSYR